MPPSQQTGASLRSDPAARKLQSPAQITINCTARPEEQVIGILKDAELDSVLTALLARKKMFGGFGIGESKRSKQLEDRHRLGEIMPLQ